MVNKCMKRSSSSLIIRKIQIKIITPVRTTIIKKNTNDNCWRGCGEKGTPIHCCGEGDGTPLQYSCLENPMDGGAWWAAVHGLAKSRTRLSDFTFTFHFHVLEKEMATHSSVLAWRNPGTGKPGGRPSMGSHRVGHNGSDLEAAAAAAAYTVGGNVNCCSRCGKQYESFSKN